MTEQQEKAMRMALEALNIHCSFATRDKPEAMGIGIEAIQALRQALAQQDKECVAIVNEGMGGIEWLSPPLPDDTPLYTAPPKREWVGLTDEEIDIVFDKHFDRYAERNETWPLYERELEAKLKEKNGCPVCPPCNHDCNEGRDCPARRKQ